MKKIAVKLILIQLVLIIPFYLLSGIYIKHTLAKRNQNILAYLEQNQTVPQSKNPQQKNELPTRLKIPRIMVDAAVQQVGLTPDGAMEIPSNTTDVGWFNLGPRPGEMGSAVIAGHFDGENNLKGVFLNLSELRVGDKIYVENNQGVTRSFIVREIHTYDPGYVDEVFSQGGGAHLNLITCDGLWDEGQKSFSKRLVVFTDLL